MFQNRSRVAMCAVAVCIAIMAAGRFLYADDKPEDRGKGFDRMISDHSAKILREGRRIFRFDPFGSEEFWGGKLRLHEAIAGSANGGVGQGLTP